MKKQILICIAFLSWSSIHLGTQNMPSPSLSNNSVFDQMPTAEQLEEINRYLETLDPKELEELARIGEEIIKEAEKEGRPLFPEIPKPQPTVPKPPQQKPKKTESKNIKKKEDNKPKVPEISSKDKTVLQKMLSLLVESIATIRQKTVSDERLADILLPENILLNDMTYYLNVVNYSKYLGCLMDAEFTPLRKELEKLATQLSDIADKLEVPEITTKKFNKQEQEAQKQIIKKAEKLLTTFIDTIKSTITQKHIITDLERVLKKYEPEALKIKQERDASEKKALTQAKTLPTTNSKIISAGSSKTQIKTQKYAGNTRQRGGWRANSTNPMSSIQQPHKSTAQTSGQNQKAGSNTKDQKKDIKDDKKQDNKRKLTPVEESTMLGEQIKEQIDKINSKIAGNRDRLHHFTTEYVTSADPLDKTISNQMKIIIEDITFDINRTKKKIGEWLTKIAKHTETSAEYKKYTNSLKSFMKTGFAEGNDLNEKAKLTSTKMPVASPRSTEHKGDLTDLSSAIDKLYKEIDKVV